MTTSQPILSAPDIGATDNALRAALIRVLDGSGLGYEQWVALRVLGVRGGSVPASQLAGLLVSGLKISAAAAASVLDDLRDAGMTHAAGADVRLTPGGAASYQRLGARVEDVSARLWADLDPDDLAAARRVLTTLTERANAFLGG